MAGAWRPTIRLFLRDRIIRWLFLLALITQALTIVALVIFFPRGVAVPLHYSVIFGIDFIGDARQIYKLPMVGIMLAIINVIVAVWIWRKDRVISYFIAGGTFFVTLILSAAAVLAIVLNKA